MCVISFTGRGKWGVAAHRRLSGKRSFYFHYIIWHNLSGLQRDAASGALKSRRISSPPHALSYIFLPPQAARFS